MKAGSCNSLVGKGIARALALATAVVPAIAIAQPADPKPWQLNMGEGVTHSSQMAYERTWLRCGSAW